jgi:hypothetical protein
MTYTALEALKELLAAGSAFREAEYNYRKASSVKAHKLFLSADSARNRLLQAEDLAREVIDSAGA